MDLKLNEEQLNLVISGAILQALTPEHRDELIRGALAKLIEPSTNTYDRGQSALTRAFDKAVSSLAHKIAEEMIAEDGNLKARIRELLASAVEKSLSDPNKLVDDLAGKLSRWLTGDRY